MIYDLPTELDVQGVMYEIRSDYRPILDIIEAMNDPDLSDQDRAYIALDIFFPGFDEMPPEHYEEAIRLCCWFINGGEEERKKKGPTLMSWEQDFKIIVAPINRVFGNDIRSVPYDYEKNTGGVHWWTVLGCFNEIGDCLFAQVVGIRDKKARGKKLDKQDQEFYRKNRDLVDLKQKYTAEENAFFDKLLGR